jgi:glyoxylase-like metal-dependent hydrolase (beta-lactamase superfamily II)
VILVGPWSVSLLETGWFSLDGGAMFGIVPHGQWSTIHAPDAAGRVRLAARCVLARHQSGRVVVIDAGMGGRWLGRARESYAVEPSHDGGGLVASLAAEGVAPGDVTDVVLTHLHFDHAGGLVELRPDRRPAAVLPAARVHVQAEQLAWAKAPSIRDRASYRAADFVPIEAAGLLVVHEGPGEILPDLEVRLSHGHTPALQMPLLRAAPGAATPGVVFPSDLVPTAAHVQPAWIMAYDDAPVTTAAEKIALLDEAAAEGWTIVSDHDPAVAALKVHRAGSRFEVEPVDI